MSANAVLAAVSVGSNIFGFANKRKARKRQQRAGELRNRITEIQNARERREAIRQARIAQAGITTAGIEAGVELDSSVVQGARQSVNSQLHEGLKTADIFTAYGREAQRLDNKAANDLGRAALFGTIGDLAGSFGGYEGLRSLGETIFGSGTKTTGIPKGKPPT